MTIDLRQERIRRAATANGCKPIWSEHYRAWCCGCDDGRHMGDQQCSILTMASAERTGGTQMRSIPKESTIRVKSAARPLDLDSPSPCSIDGTRREDISLLIRRIDECTHNDHLLHALQESDVEELRHCFSDIAACVSGALKNLDHDGERQAPLTPTPPPDADGVMVCSACRATATCFNCRDGQ